MKISLLFIFFYIIISPATGQKSKKEKDSYYVYDSLWNPCQLDKAKYMGYVRQLDDTTYRWSMYHFTGTLMSVETYKDNEAKIPNGYFAWYDENGIIDSSGYSLNGKKDSHWYTYDDTLAVIIEREYSNGTLVRIIDHNDPSYKRQVDLSDSLPGDKEADFKGGVKAWIKYLEKNYQFPSRALSLNKFGKVMVDFVVDTTGKVKNPRIVKSVEFSLDQEAIRLIEQSTNWIPAIRNRKKVNAFRRQPITFAKPE